MAKIIGYEVTALKPVCIDFPDGRTVSFQPGMRFEAHPTNMSVRRLLSVREIRVLGLNERVPPLPEKLGAPKAIRDILKARKEVTEAHRLAKIKALQSKKSPPPVEEINLGNLTGRNNASEEN